MEIHELSKFMINEGYEGKMRIKGFYKDVTGKEYVSSNALSINPNEWIKT